MEFSITEQQVPMLLRLAALIMALQTKQFSSNKEKSLISVEERDDSTEGIFLISIHNKYNFQSKRSTILFYDNFLDDTDHVSRASIDNSSWGGWAWDMVSSLLPIDWDNDWSAEQQMAYSGHTIHLGIYIQFATFTFKVFL